MAAVSDDNRRHWGHRLYLHGDLGADGRAYCALCDRFLALEHFEQHGVLNAERYKQSVDVVNQLARLTRVMLGVRANLFVR